MSILIKGMEMPKDGAERCIVIRGDGKIRTFTGAPIDYATAIPVPPHGRLISAERIEYELCESTILTKLYRDYFRLVINSE